MKIRKSFFSKANFNWIAAFALAATLFLGACSEQSPTSESSVTGPAKSVAPPYPALTPNVPAPTPTDFEPIPALLPTNTLLPLPDLTPVPGSNGNGLTATPIPIKPTPTKAVKAVITTAAAVSSGGLLAYIQGGDLWTVNTDGTNRRQLSNNGQLDSDKLYWSPLRDRLAYIAPNGSLNSLDLFGHVSVLFSPTQNQSLLDLVWSPSGRYLVFTVHANDATAITGGEIWLVDAIAAHFTPRKLVDGFAPAWSPDSQSIAYLSRSQAKQVPASTPPVLTAYNELVVYNLASNTNRTLAASINLPPYTGLDDQAHTPDATTLRLAWWSPNGKLIFFSDRQSILGQVVAGGGQAPFMWAGQPDAFAVNKLYWINKDQTPLIFWSSSGAEGNQQVATLVGPGKLSKFTTSQADCLALLPGGTLMAFADAQATLVARSDGSVYGLYNGGGCPSWSPDGKALATVKRSTDGGIVILTPNAAKSFELETVKGVDSVYWLKSGNNVVIQGGAGPKGP